MSDSGIPVETVTVTANRIPETGIVRPQRSIGGLVADITVEEEHQDELAITQHPVEKTADITDHAYPLPVTLTVRVGYSPAGPAPGSVLGALFSSISNIASIFGAGDPVPLQTIYDQYLQMQKGRQLLEVQTGKRLYENMLIRTISLVTDKDTENALFLTLGLQEIILVETTTVTVPANNVQDDPSKTGNVQKAGTKNLTPNPASYNASGSDADVVSV